MTLAVFISGATRGVGLEIAKRYARMGAQVAIVGKTEQPHPKLAGTLSTAKEEILAAGAAKVLAIPCDVRNLVALKAAIDQAGTEFGRLDVVVNNASALYLLPLTQVSESKFNLMHEVIVRASFFAVQYALPYLHKSERPHVVQLAPKPELISKWFSGHTAYTMCKFAAAMQVVGLASELQEQGIAINAVWPKTLLATAAVKNLLGGAETVAHSRHPRIVADAVALLTAKPTTVSGQFFLDEELLVEQGVELSSYAMVAGAKLITDLYVSETSAN